LGWGLGKELTGGAGVSAGKTKKERRRRREGGSCGACWAVGFGLAQLGCLFFSNCFLSIFCFLISFISFAFWFHIKSNQLVKFSKIQNVNARQQGTSSHDKICFQQNFTNLTKNGFICIMQNRIRVFKIIL
jgi:hypothetical protein